MSQLLEIEKPSVTMSITSKSNNNMSSNTSSQVSSTLTAPLPDVLANGDHAIKIKTDLVKDGKDFFFVCFSQKRLFTIV